MGICWWLDLNIQDLSPTIKVSTHFIAGHKWKLIKWKVTSKCQSWWSLRFWICFHPLLPFCWLPSGYSSSWFPIGSRWFLKNNNSGAFSGGKKVEGGFKADRFFSSFQPTRHCPQNKMEQSPVQIFLSTGFLLNQQTVYSEPWKSKVLWIIWGETDLIRLVLQIMWRFPELF